MAAVASREQKLAGAAETEIVTSLAAASSWRLFRPHAGFKRYIRAFLRAE
jgi:hypothetical protein